MQSSVINLRVKNDLKNHKIFVRNVLTYKIKSLWVPMKDATMSEHQKSIEPVESHKLPVKPTLAQAAQKEAFSRHKISS